MSPEPQPTHSGSTVREPDMEYHDGEGPAVCVGQWCCGCRVHPVGKPWGWNFAAWERHHDEHHPFPKQPNTVVYKPEDFG